MNLQKIKIKKLSNLQRHFKGKKKETIKEVVFTNRPLEIY